MRRLLSVCALMAAVAASGWSGESSKVTMLDGVYSIVVPEDWTYEIDPQDSTVSLEKEGHEDSVLIILAPNPTVDGELDGYAGGFLGYFSNRIGAKGKLEVLSDDRDDVDGYQSLTLVFNIPNNTEPVLSGLIHTLDVDGFAVMMMAFSTPDDFAEFVVEAGAIMDSFKVDEEAMYEQRESLEIIGQALLEEVAAALM